MDNSTKPIFTIGHYQLVHRANNGYQKLTQHDEKTPVLFSMLSGMVGFAAFSTIPSVISQGLVLFGVSTFIALLVGLGMLYLLIAFCSYHFLSTFVLINTKDGQSNRHITGRLSLLSWIMAVFLAILAVVIIVLRYATDFSSIILNAVFLILALSFLGHQVYQMLLKH